MMPGPFFRIAWRDARDVVLSRAWLVMFFAPLLLVLLMVMLILAVSLLMTAVRVAAPEESPMGHDTVAVVLAPDVGQTGTALYQEVVEALRRPAPDAPAEARLMRRFVGFMLEARAGRPVAPSRDDRKEGEEAEEGRGLEVIARPDGDWDAISAQVPEEIDAAVLLEPTRDGRARYRIAYDPGLLYSRLMQRRVVQRIEGFNRAHREAAAKGPIEMRVQDHREAGQDLWLVQSIFFLMSLGLVFIYHSVAVQSVAGVLAGERESRTLEVLLSLPVTRRQVLYGKTLALVLTTAAPTLFWSAWLWAGLWWLFRLALPYAALVLLLVALHGWMMAVGCAVSAGSPNTLVARSRLGMVNMVFFALGGSFLALPSWLWPGGIHPVAAVVGVVTGGPEAWPMLVGLLVALLGGAVVVLEIGMRGFRKA